MHGQLAFPVAPAHGDMAAAALVGFKRTTLPSEPHKGGMAEMTIVAQALEVGVPLVIAFHLFRVVVVNMGTQYIYALAMRLRRR